MEYLLVWNGSCIVLRQKEAKMSKIKFLFNEREIFVGNYSFTFVKNLLDLNRSDLLDCSSDQDCSVRMTEDTAEKVLDLLAEEYENATKDFFNIKKECRK
jgi:hypothetical protein